MWRDHDLRCHRSVPLSGSSKADPYVRDWAQSCRPSNVALGSIVLKKSAMKPWIHSHRSVLIKVDATSSP